MNAPLPPACPFCSLAGERIIARTELAVAIRDGFPVSPGHTLVIPAFWPYQFNRIPLGLHPFHSPSNHRTAGS